MPRHLLVLGFATALLTQWSCGADTDNTRYQCRYGDGRRRECAAEHFCDSAGFCKPKNHVGEPCGEACLEPSYCGVTGLCELEQCGNGVPEPPVEACDDGNQIEGDDCNATCTRVTICGNGKLDVGEVCDDHNYVSRDGCSENCLSDETCMNGVVDPPEGCDDGNDVNTDGCKNTCDLPRCGDGVVSAYEGVVEECDDGNPQSGDSCQSTCTVPRCGDGFIDLALLEACDDGNHDDGDGCSADCLHSDTCGDGFNDMLGEQCDDGNNTSGDGCQSNCRLPMCGDHWLDAGEVCDDGNRWDSDLCASDCSG
jgi:cysteine-rich repeat protein